MVHAGADPESHLRWLTTEALRDAVSGLRLAPVSIGLQAVANAFAMLGLLPEARAEAVLAAHKSGIVAAVADSLLAVGALPAGRVLLRQRPEDPESDWRRALVHAWSRRAGRSGDGFLPGERHGLPADSWHGSATNEGSGGFVFWPPVGPGTRHLRVIVSTFWEAAWADIELPAPVAAGQRGVAGDG